MILQNVANKTRFIAEVGQLLVISTSPVRSTKLTHEILIHTDFQY